MGLLVSLSSPRELKVVYHAYIGIGSFVGVYATNNGNTKSNTPSYISNWVYQGQGQYIGNGEFYPSNGKKGGAGF